MSNARNLSKLKPSTAGLIEADDLAVGAVSFSGVPVQVAYADVFGSVTLPNTSVIPADNTIPQNTEGTEVLSVTITPKKATSYLLVEACLTGCEVTNVGDYIVAALFRDSGADALAVGLVAGMGGGAASLTDGQCWVRLRVAAGPTSATTFKIRAANNNGLGYLNANHNSFTFGGKINSTLTVTEIEA